MMIISAMNNFYMGMRRIITNGKPITIIRYHSINNISDPYTISPKAFLRQAEFISNNYNIFRLKNINEIFSVKNEIIRTVIFTFDDAYEDFLENAYPIIDKLSIPCTLFIPSGYIGKYNDWDLHLDNYIKRPIMTSSQLIDLKKQGMVDFGSHSVNHNSMSKLSLSEMKKQAIESKNKLEDILNGPIKMFSYPFGHFSKITRRVLQEAQYDIAVTSKWGTFNTSDQILNLKRIYLNEGDTYDHIRAKINGLHDLYHVRGIGSKLLAYQFKKIHTE